MGVSRRRVVQLVAGAGLLAAIPVGQHVIWNSKDFTREDYSAYPPDAPEGRTSWSNWSGIEQAVPENFSRPQTEAELADLVRAARGRVRPVGSGHSFTGLARSDGTMVDVSRFAGLTRFDAATGRAVFGAGTRLFQAAAELAKLGRALPNLPDIDVQTLAGGFATGTHGTGRTLTPLHDYLSAFRLVLADGSVREVTRAGEPDLFAGGKVSLGALGIMTEVTLDTVPAFNLRRIVEVARIGDVLDRAETMSKAHRNFEFYYFPNTGLAATITHDLHEGEVSGVQPSADDTTLQDLQALRDTFGWWPWLRRKIVQSALPFGVVEDMTDASWKLLATTRPIKFNEMEYHLPLDQGMDGLRAIIREIDRHKNIYFPMEVRFTAGDTAWLSPFNGGPRMSIAIHAGVDEPYDYFFSVFEPIHRAHGGRPHWGKLHSLAKADLETLYPDFQNFLDLRASLDPTGKFLNAHLAKLVGIPFDA